MEGCHAIGAGPRVGGIVGSCFFAFLLRSGFAWAPFALVGLLYLAFLIYAGRHERHVDTALPASLGGSPTAPTARA